MFELLFTDGDDIWIFKTGTYEECYEKMKSDFMSLMLENGGFEEASELNGNKALAIVNCDLYLWRIREIER